MSWITLFLLSCQLLGEPPPHIPFICSECFCCVNHSRKRSVWILTAVTQHNRDWQRGVCQPLEITGRAEHNKAFPLTLVVQQRHCHKVMRHGAVVVGFHLSHGGPEQRHVVFELRLDHALMDLIVDFCHLAGKRRHHSRLKCS